MKNKLSKILIIAIIFNSYSFTFASTPNICSANIFNDVYNNIKNFIFGKNGYTIKWINYDGTILEIDENIKEDEYPYYDSDIPSKTNDGDVYYIFKGWQPEISKVKKDITYTALFEESDIEVSDGMEIGNYKIDNSLLNIAIMTDPHVPYESRYAEFGKTNEELFKNRIENAIYDKDVNAILVSGDLTKEGKSEEYDLYNKVISNYKDKCEFITSAGNHEFIFNITGVRNRRSQFKNVLAPRWRSKMKTGLYYSKWLGDTHIVCLADNYYNTDILDSEGKKTGYGWARGWISNEELDWFENIIKDDDEKGITTIVLCHWPIINTKNGSNHQKSYWTMQSSEERIKEIVSNHNNVILFSGHTHGKFNGDLPVQIDNGGMFVHAGALTSNQPTYVNMKEINADINIKKYELKYILPNNESKTFYFSHDTVN